MRRRLNQFLRRWTLHILPKGHVRIRHYGFLSAAAKAKLERLRHILGVLAPPPPLPHEPPSIICRDCGKAMLLIGRIDPRPLWKDLLAHLPSPRGPPPTATP